jgi:hypothetical protein
LREREREREREKTQPAFPELDSPCFVRPSQSRVPCSCYLGCSHRAFGELCFNVRPLAFIEGRYKNHLVEQHFGIFCKTAVEDIIHCVTQCPLYKDPHDKFWLVFSSKKKFYFCR